MQHERRGREHLWVLDPQPLLALADWSAAYRSQWEARFDRLNDLLAVEDE